MPKLSKEAYNEVLSLIDNEMELNKGMGRTQRLDDLYTVREEIEGIGTF